MSRSKKSRMRARRERANAQRARQTSAHAHDAQPHDAQPAPAAAPLDMRIATYAMVAAFAALAYLAMVNLDWAMFWDDEGTIAYLARNWIELGAPLVDDGRNVYSWRGGADIAEDGTFRYPKLLTALLAAVFSVFGYGEVAARMVSVVFTLGGMALFGLALRDEFPRRRGLAAAAFALACLSPMTLGYARSITYNSVVLFLHMLMLWSYLQFCARKNVLHMAVLAVAAVTAFHLHYFSNATFVAALAAMHLLFRRHYFDRRAWVIAIAAGAVWTAQAAWVFATEFSHEVYVQRGINVNADALYRTFKINFGMLTDNAMLAWSVALGFVLWRAAVFARALPRRKTSARAHAWRELRDDRALQYLAFVLFGVCALSVTGVFIGAGGDVRYFTSFTPLAAIPAAALLCGVWRMLKPAGVVLFCALLLSDIAGWPFLNGYYRVAHGGKPSWTLPALINEYHRDYPDSMRESFAYMREQVPADSLLYTNHLNTSVMLWYLSDHVRICCTLTRARAPQVAANIAARNYLYKEDVQRAPASDDALTPQYLWMVADAAGARDDMRLKSDGARYVRVENFPDATLGFGSFSRPEWAWHAPRPQAWRARGERKVNAMYLYARDE